MIKKQAIASILAVVLTFLSGSYNLTFATSTFFSSTTLLKSKAETTCPTPFTTYPFCGSNGECTISAQQIFLPKALYAASVDKQKPNEISMEYTVAQAEPSPTITETPAVTTDSPTPTVAVQAAVAYNTITPPAGGSASLNAEVMFGMINQIRTQSGLPAFEKDPRICDVANSRAPEVYGEIMSGHMHAGMARRTFDYWVNENIIYNNTEQGAVNWWMNSPVHRSALLGNSKYACVACNGNSCSMIFTSFIPK